MPPSADRNLLFGILALQMDFINRDQLVAAMNAWIIDKKKPLGEILVQHRAMPASDFQLLEPLVARHIEQHGNDPQKSLAAVSSVSSIREQLTAIPDHDVQSSLGYCGGDYVATKTALPPTDDRDGTRYRILRPHARGGLGEVFVAQDVELNREVALKEIQQNKDRSDTRSRFVFEAEVTGGLEHPGIVPVYGLGHYQDGRPYYAMRFIKGDNLGEAIKRFHNQHEHAAQASADRTHMLASRPHYDSLEFRRLLQRFIDVCNAVAYAHSRGVLHRDLKPGNIMLGKYGETLVVDWGLAKTQASRERERRENDGESTLQPTSGSDMFPTQHGSALGTPAYMSPEQAEGRLDQLGPASDVYSLGATLYHLLLGKPANVDCDVLEILTRCQKGEIKPPRSINPAIPKALDAVCSKAMAHRTVDRYATAQELGADLEHWLADEPVSAITEPFSIRFKRWVRKHPRTASSLAASLVFGVIGLGGLAWQREQARLAIAKQESETAKQRDLADGRFDMALNAFNQMVFDMQSLLEKRAGTVEVRRELLAQARPGLEKLLQEAEAARGADHTLVWSYFRMGDVALNLGDTNTAYAEYEKGHDMAKRLADADPNNARIQRDLSVSFTNLGDVTRQMGNIRGGFEYYRKGLDIRQRLADADPNDAQAHRDLSVSFEKLGHVTRQMGSVPETLEYYRKGLDIRQRLTDDDPKNDQAQRDLSSALENIGDVTRQMGNAADALKFYRKGMHIKQRLADIDPKDAQAQRDLCASFERLGDVTEQMGNAAEALEYYRKGQDISHRLAHADPKNAQAQRNLSLSFIRLGIVTEQMGNALGALEYYRKCLDICQRLADADPNNAQAQRDLSNLFERLGDVTEQMGNALEALEYYRKGRDIDQRLANADAKNAQAQRDLSNSFERLGDMTLLVGNAPEALEYYRKCLHIRQRLADADAKDAQAHRDLAISFEKMGGVNKEMLQFREATDWYKKMVDHVNKWPDPQALHLNMRNAESGIVVCPKVEQAVADLPFALTQSTEEVPRLLDARMRVLAKKGDAAGCLATAEAMANLNMTDARGLYHTSCLWSLCADAAKNRHVECYDKAMDSLKRAVAAGYKNIGQLKIHKDLDGLRDRVDFKTLMAELEANVAKK